MGAAADDPGQGRHLQRHPQVARGLLGQRRRRSDRGHHGRRRGFRLLCHLRLRRRLNRLDRNARSQPHRGCGGCGGGGFRAGARLASGALFLGESLAREQIVGVVLVFAGLVVNVYGLKMRAWLARLL